MKNTEALTTGQVGKYCGVNFRTVIRWIERGDLQAYKLPGRGDHRITPENFIAFLKKNNMPIPLDFQECVQHILIVDDDELMAASIERMLKRQGFEITVAHNGFDAGVYLTKNTPGLVLLDLMMPGLDGFAVLDSIKKLNNITKTLIISGLGEDKLEQALNQGADDVLKKPFEMAQLLEKIETLLSTP